MENKKILFIYAHPDDETFGSAGTIAKYSKHDDIDIYVASATRGEAGKLGDPPLTTRENLGKYREAELKNAAKIIGVKDIIFLDFIDGTLDKLSLDEHKRLVNTIANLITSIKPDILVIFPEDGVSKHKDHIAMHYACMEAIELASANFIIPKIYYNVMPKKIYSLRGLDNYGVPDNHITTKIDITEFRHIKFEALKMHETQVFSVNKVYPNLLESQDINIIHNFEYYKLIRKNGINIDFTKFRENSFFNL